MYDFSPKSIVVPGSLGGTPDPKVTEAQQLLKQMGYDPGAIDGIWGAKTRSALAALWMAVGRSDVPPTEITEALLVELRTVAQRGPAQTPPAQATSLVESTAKTPFWQSPVLIGAGAIVGSIALYLMFREAKSPMSGVEEGAEKDEPEKLARKRKKKEESEKSLVEKCPRVPDFEKGEVMAEAMTEVLGPVIEGEVLETTTVPAT
jgi:hypothetical protein